MDTQQFIRLTGTDDNPCILNLTEILSIDQFVTYTQVRIKGNQVAEVAETVDEIMAIIYPPIRQL